CVIERWGIESGGGIDMVGCHNGLITGNRFRHDADPANTGGTGIQAKGGTRNIIIRQNSFEHAGARSLNIGGSTGMQFFRPPLDQWPKGEPRYEASDITVEGNTFIGSTAPFAFVGVDRAVVRDNTIYMPGKWALRILQETKEPGFVACRGGTVRNNIFVFRSDQWGEGGVNIGPDTAPDTFRFSSNLWFCIDRPEASQPRLPVAEEGGIYGIDPQFTAPEAGDLRLRSGSPAAGKGAAAFRPAE
ncbi:MAG TPA: right-handed parallel beta-helix repeat-containing protein, partial [Chthoniobacteraceae bacterium]